MRSTLLILALCGDHRIGSGVGKLGLTELRAGIPYPVAAMAIVRAELAPPAVRVLAMRAELVDSGPEAVELGLLDELAEPDALLDRALEACVLAPVAWVSRDGSPRVAVLALVGLGASYLASYERARGESLGFRVA